ncbi:MAG: hypothetical protein SFV23_00430 [Planctomycetaceae bacterium]|nr:hypothetical protein [Planctomycetaceae bacterium]
MSDAAELTGVVNEQLELLISFRVFTAKSETVKAEVTAVIDTGFSGGLALPEEICESLGFEVARFVSGELADGSKTIVPIYFAEVDWCGVEREIEIAGAGRTPLVGVQLLANQSLLAEFVPGGQCRIFPIEP